MVETFKDPPITPVEADSIRLATLLTFPLALVSISGRAQESKQSLRPAKAEIDRKIETFAKTVEAPRRILHMRAAAEHLRLAGMLDLSR